MAEEAFYNFWSVPVFELFLDSIRANQAVGGKCDGNLPMNVPAAIPNRKPDDISWTAAYPLITNWLYQYYGDLGAAKEHWPTLKRYMDGQRAQMADPEAARPHTPIGADQVPDFWSCGDWCAIESRAICTPNTGPPAAAANFILATEAMVAMAEALGEMADHAKYKSWLAPFRATYDKTYWNSSLTSYAKTDLEVCRGTIHPPHALHTPHTRHLAQTTFHTQTIPLRQFPLLRQSRSVSCFQPCTGAVHEHDCAGRRSRPSCQGWRGAQGACCGHCRDQGHTLDGRRDGPEVAATDAIGGRCGGA
eukprot:COSAG01_NODE_732_length_13996_cov_33.626322_14_plen_305_part_00